MTTQNTMFLARRNQSKSALVVKVLIGMAGFVVQFFPSVETQENGDSPTKSRECALNVCSLPDVRGPSEGIAQKSQLPGPSQAFAYLHDSLLCQGSGSSGSPPAITAPHWHTTPFVILLRVIYYSRSFITSHKIKSRTLHRTDHKNSWIQW